jgi:hypothetical protein
LSFDDCRFKKIENVVPGIPKRFWNPHFCAKKPEEHGNLMSIWIISIKTAGNPQNYVKNPEEHRGARFLR